ncbi:response regulator [Deinococcus sp. QL22]|uniref:response regulator n=1 Tax=Deinococcus sp. QL22 TaxID=2939437 RepID=UPI0020174622|nr:response regulator [Deinococcus sp. QL22]UQN04905.1 response regulator [Deinococcus sp. QL22]
MTHARPLRVLLVDDNLTDRLLAEEAFGLIDRPCDLVTAESGEAALKLLTHPETLLPDVLLLDVNMPGMNGFELLAKLKDTPQLLLIPVVMLTTSAIPKDVSQAYILHASAYMIKSASFQTSLEQIEKFIEFWIQARVTTRSEMITP